MFWVCVYTWYSFASCIISILAFISWKTKWYIYSRVALSVYTLHVYERMKKKRVQCFHLQSLFFISFIIIRCNAECSIYWLYQLVLLKLLPRFLACHIFVAVVVCFFFFCTVYKRAYARLSGFRSRYHGLFVSFPHSPFKILYSLSWIAFAQCMSKLSNL